jgi:hypothetical protein
MTDHLTVGDALRWCKEWSFFITLAGLWGIFCVAWSVLELGKEAKDSEESPIEEIEERTSKSGIEVMEIDGVRKIKDE